MKLSVQPQELSSTLLFVGVNDNRYLGGHIGDGVIGYFDKNKRPKTLSYPDNDENGNTYLTTQLDLFDHFRIYKGGLNDIKGFVLMSDGLFDSLFNKTKNNLFGENTTIFEYLNHHSATVKEIEETIREDIKTGLLQLSDKGDDCSIILMSLVERKKKLKTPKKPDLVLDEKQLTNNTKRIDRLQEFVTSVENELKILNNRVADKVDKNGLKKYDSALDKLTAKQAEDAKTIDRFKKDISSIKSELTDLKNSLNDKGDEINNLGKTIPIEEIKSLIKWKNNVKIWLIIGFAALVILSGIIAKLLFFN